MKITDSMTLGDARVSTTGYLEANARTARVGVQQYLGSEVDRPDLSVVNVYRDANEVFAKASLDTFANIPVTMDHPPAGVNAESWKDHSVGTSLNEVLRDGEFLKIGLKIMDAAAVKAVQDGKNQLSVGYSTQLVWGDGVAPDGTKYQAKQTAIVADHIAIVAQGRAGSQVRIGDNTVQWGAAPILPTTDEEPRTMSDALRTVVVDGLSVSTTDQGAQAITTLMQRIADAATKATETATAHTVAIAAKDKDLATKDAEIDALKAKVVDGPALDKLVADRAALIGIAKAIAKDVKLDGLADADIRKAVVTANLGDAAVKDKSADYINARFDILAEDAGKTTDAFRTVVQQGVTQTADGDASGKAYQAMADQLTSAWQNPNGKAA